VDKLLASGELKEQFYEKGGILKPYNPRLFCGSGWESNTKALCQERPLIVDGKHPDSRNAGTTYGDSVDGDGWMDAAPVEAPIVDADPYGEPPEGKLLPASIVFKTLFPEFCTVSIDLGRGFNNGHPDGPIDTPCFRKLLNPLLTPLQYPEFPVSGSSVLQGAV
jgi:hypothetical protein